MSEGMIDAYVTSLGKYNEGELRGGLSLPYRHHGGGSSGFEEGRGRRQDV